MYAIIRTGGKQYRVEAGTKVRVEKLDQALGSEIDVSEVLFVGGETSHTGDPVVKGAKVRVVVVDHDRAPKIHVFKKKRRHSFRKLKGHRQHYTELFVKSITSPSGEATSAEFKTPRSFSRKQVAATTSAN